MAIWKFTRRTVLLAMLVAFSATLAVGQQNQSVATLDRMKGKVQVVQADTGRVVQGRTGLLLNLGDRVKTLPKSATTIKFRDGSEIRLFARSNFLIRKVKESKGKERSFLYRLTLKVGSFWGRFVPQRQVATIGTPTATIGIKGTTLRIVERDNQARVALTEGLIDVENDRSKIELQPGKRLTNFRRGDDLATKIEDIPFKLVMSSEKRSLKFSGRRSEEVFVSIQLTNIKSGGQIRRPGVLYLRSDYDKIVYPASAELDQRGFARIPLVFFPPEAADGKFNGTIYVWAVLDEEDADDTTEGRLKFTIPVPEGRERVRIEADSGSGQRSQ